MSGTLLFPLVVDVTAAAAVIDLILLLLTLSNDIFSSSAINNVGKVKAVLQWLL